MSDVSSLTVRMYLRTSSHSNGPELLIAAIPFSALSQALQRTLCSVMRGGYADTAGAPAE
jgi:hypothetical protein